MTDDHNHPTRMIRRREWCDAMIKRCEGKISDGRNDRVRQCIEVYEHLKYCSASHSSLVKGPVCNYQFTNRTE